MYYTTWHLLVTGLDPHSIHKRKYLIRWVLVNQPMKRADDFCANGLTRVKPALLRVTLAQISPTYLICWFTRTHTLWIICLVTRKSSFMHVITKWCWPWCQRRGDPLLLEGRGGTSGVFWDTTWGRGKTHIPVLRTNRNITSDKFKTCQFLQKGIFSPLFEIRKYFRT